MKQRPGLMSITPTHDTFRAKFARWRHPGSSWCGRCGRPWTVRPGKGTEFTLKNHATDYGQGSACFPLCESCWSQLTIDERLPYYVALVNEWERIGSPVPEDKKTAIYEAVRAGR